MLENKKQKDIKMDTERAYSLAKQDEVYKEMNANFMSKLYTLTNNNNLK